MLTTQEKTKIKTKLKQDYIYSIFADNNLFQKIITNLSKPFENEQIDKVLGIEARGFILGAAVANELNKGFIVARKEGKVFKGDYDKSEVLNRSLKDYSDKRKRLEIEKNSACIEQGDKILIVDDWFETGSQGKAVIKMLEELNAKITGVSILLDEMGSETRTFFENYNLNSLVDIN